MVNLIVAAKKKNTFTNEATEEEKMKHRYKAAGGIIYC